MVPLFLKWDPSYSSYLVQCRMLVLEQDTKIVPTLLLDYMHDNRPIIFNVHT